MAGSYLGAFDDLIQLVLCKSIYIFVVNCDAGHGPQELGICVVNCMRLQLGHGHVDSSTLDVIN